VASKAFLLKELTLCLGIWGREKIDSPPDGLRDPKEVLEGDDACSVVLR
jgi:hypothetical protein